MSGVDQSFFIPHLHANFAILFLVIPEEVSFLKIFNLHDFCRNTRKTCSESSSHVKLGINLHLLLLLAFFSIHQIFFGFFKPLLYKGSLFWAPHCDLLALQNINQSVG